MDLHDITIGHRYSDTTTGWTGTCTQVWPGQPQPGEKFTVDGTTLTAVGPDPGAPSERWVMASDDGLDTIELASLDLRGRAALLAQGPKGAPEIRYSDPDDLRSRTDDDGEGLLDG